MGDVVRASFEGLDELAALAADQQRYVEAVQRLVEGSCGRMGAFTGLMWFFKGAYSDAHATVVSELAQAGKDASDVSAAFRTVVATYRHHDKRASERMQAIRVRVGEARGTTAQEGDEGFAVPHALKVAGGMTDYADVVSEGYGDYARRLGELPMPGPLDVPGDLRGLPTDGVALVSDFTDTLGEGESISAATTDRTTYDAFEQEHAGGRP